ncbi:ATP-binding protein [Thermoactinospora rubra]|uniref:ATP-binding protein n=1 Tax=Thermoactinospora rubra TaxID=1088767 RepID=UPI000A10F421|nr:ATP-binding protein [Thermoactinospora rubra]
MSAAGPARTLSAGGPPARDASHVTDGFAGGTTTSSPQKNPLMSASWTLPHHPASAPAARKLLRAQALAWQVDHDVAELLVSEVVTNALRHAPGPVRLTVWLIEGLLRCEVEDRNTVALRARHPAEHDEGGYGLGLLDALACCWGSIPTPTGKAVWFELPAADAKL